MTTTQSEAAVQINGAPLTTSLSEANAAILANAIDNRIVKIRPMSTPIDQISRCGDTRHVGSMKVFYYMADVKEVETTLTEALGRDSYIAEEGNSGILKIKVAKPTIFSPTETILLPEIDIDGSPLTLYIKSVESDGLTCYIANHMTSYATQLQDVCEPGNKIIRMGRAAGELDVQTPQFETLPKRDYNLCQIFKMQIEESTLHRLSNKEAQWGFSDQEEVAIIDMRQGMEKNFIFGTRSKIAGAGTGADDVYLTGGIWNQSGLESFVYDSDSLNEQDLIKLCRKAFTGGKGSARKILMGGSDFIEKLSTFDYKHIVVGTRSAVHWGLEFREIKSNFGTLCVIHNEIFDQCGHSADAMVIDPNMLTKYVHIPFTAERLDLRTSGTRNTEAVVLTEASCVVLRNPKCHLRVIAS